MALPAGRLAKTSHLHQWQSVTPVAPQACGWAAQTHPLVQSVLPVWQDNPVYISVSAKEHRRDVAGSPTCHQTSLIYYCKCSCQMFENSGHITGLLTRTLASISVYIHRPLSIYICKLGDVQVCRFDEVIKHNGGTYGRQSGWFSWLLFCAIQVWWTQLLASKHKIWWFPCFEFAQQLFFNVATHDSSHLSSWEDHGQKWQLQHACIAPYCRYHQDQSI